MLNRKYKLTLDDGREMIYRSLNECLLDAREYVYEGYDVSVSMVYNLGEP